MSFAVELAIAPPILRRLRAAMCAFAATGCVIAIAQLQPVGAVRLAAAWALVFAVFCGLLAGLAWALAKRGQAAPLPAGRFVVDAAGNAAWGPVTGTGAALQPLTVERWYVLGSFAWIGVRIAGDRRARDLLLLHGGDEPAWRKLRAWLVWYGRGRVARLPDPTVGS